MTTTAARDARPVEGLAAAPRRSVTRDDTLAGPQGAVPTGLTVLGPVVAATALTVPALLAAGRTGTATVDVAASLVLVAGLQTVAARAAWRRTRTAARPAAGAALLGRLAYALVLTVTAVGLLGPGDLLGAQRAWTAGAGVLGIGLLAHAVALSRSRIGRPATRWVAGCAGAAAVVLALVPGGAPTVPLLWCVVAGDLAAAATHALPGRGRRHRL
ncbi:hypothetical protein KMZ32_12925 [Phycicoccus sp. MAQZ13P-2]|uniref:hypothetical protein n=1 Tax=Phycicoccus mangrovi TaxID=2840470 RepID=UPI001BFFDB29|nr:hypothetical protein [Phycicoccus mangrovi]MBT9256875.1 hypothetical protein [Phycicoccus mangrovi]MBT9274976.1 hypothetical protein [Phycicoccus mangrovi]